MEEYAESLYDDYGQRFVVERVLFESRTDHQHLVIFENARFGRVMALDGVIQTTERDEFVYHEMLTHVPILAHGQARSVLIIGGGDGGILREVARHPQIERIVQVEIDPSVVEMSRAHLPGHSDGAFDDPRLELVFADGAAWMAACESTFDVVIVDSTDPIGPGEVLFRRSFYEDVRRCLNAPGIVVTQNGVAFMQLDEIESTVSVFHDLFPDAWAYGAAVPTYVGGIMAFGWGATTAGLRDATAATLRARLAAGAGPLPTRYWTPAVHVGSFALPAYVEQALQAAIAASESRDA